MSETRGRRRAILELIVGARIGTQEELAQVLAARGFSVSQSSISRDIAALGLVKLGGRYARPPVARSTRDPAAERIARGVLELRSAGDHLLVLITPAGEAAPVALALDAQGWSEIVGTLAGDDTVFVAVRDARAARTLRTRLRGMGTFS